MVFISRRCSTVFLTLLALFLLGTVIVLSTVRAYYSIDSTAYILPEELGTWEQIKWGVNPDAVAAAAAHLAALSETAAAVGADSAAILASSSASASAKASLSSAGNRNDGTLRASGSSIKGETPVAFEYNSHNNSVQPWNMNSPPERIPRIIHQTWKDSTLPPQWQVLRDECQTMHTDYEYMLWTDAESRIFIQNHYSWFLPVFDSYPYVIQRADAIRYFVLHHYGGIYMDLDIGCLRRFDPLLRFEVILPKTIPVGVSNDLMLAQKGHPFMDLVIHNLVAFNHQYLTNYPTVMFSTGPMFLSASYGMYVSKHGPAQQSSSKLPEAGFSGIRVLPKSLYGKNAKPGEAPDAFFRHLYGSSWHSNDAGFLIFLRDHGTLLMIIGFYIVAYGALRTILPRYWKGRSRTQRGWLYALTGAQPAGGASLSAPGGPAGGPASLSLGAPGTTSGGSAATLVSRLFPFRKRGRWIALRTSDPDSLGSSATPTGASGTTAPASGGGRRVNNSGGATSVRWKRSSDLEFV